MKRLPMAAIALAAALAATLGVAACGDDSSDQAGAPSAPATTAEQPGHEAAMVSIWESQDLGQVLVNGSGQLLYASEEEADGMIRCVDDCASIWVPLAASSGAPHAAGDVGRLGVVARPDGTRQVTANGHPLYTFSSDGPGEAGGNGLTDSFGGQSFTWRAMRAGGEPAAPAPMDQGSDDGYGY